MPRISQRIIDSVFYLYQSREDAEAGRDPGGTGFVVNHWRSSGQPGVDHYAVTNWHVTCEGFSVIRLNRSDGGIDVIDFGPEQWSCIPGKYDVVVAPLSLDQKVHKVHGIDTRNFVENPTGWAGHPPVGVGADVFMLGLFVDHHGITTNVPSARFGNVSMLPNENATIKQPTQYDGVSYIVDMHSRTGFSGSPVFAYRTFGSDLTAIYGHRFSINIANVKQHGDRLVGDLESKSFVKFLGIHWGQFPERWELREGAIDESRRRSLVIDGAYVNGMSGMTCVVPAWQVLEVLMMPKVQERAAAAERIS